MPDLNKQRIGLRWTIGDVSEYGYEALRIAICSAWNLFGTNARYAVCVNTVSLQCALARTGDIPSCVRWVEATNRIPDWLPPYLATNMAEGVAWKLAPIRLFPDLHEISFDNDVILWRIPEVMQSWLDSKDAGACLMAEDVNRCLGQFSDIPDGRPINSGIRGVPPGFDLEGRLRQTLSERQTVLRSELDEQGLQAAVLSSGRLSLVPSYDVSICSPFPEHQRELGQCGAHFVGLNVKTMPWEIEGRPGHEVIRERWLAFAPELKDRVFGQAKA